MKRIRLRPPNFYLARARAYWRLAEQNKEKGNERLAASYNVRARSEYTQYQRMTEDKDHDKEEV